MSAKRAATPYFAFAAAERKDVKAALVAAGAPAGVADVAKVLGERWRALPEEERKARARWRRCAALAALAGAHGCGAPLARALADSLRRCTRIKPPPPRRRCVPRSLRGVGGDSSARAAALPACRQLSKPWLAVCAAHPALLALC